MKKKLEKIENINIPAVDEKLVKAAVSLLIKHPFFGQMVPHLKRTRAEDWCDTAATDGRNFFYNPAFIHALTTQETVFLYAHEVLHNCFEHHIRRGDRDPKLWNVAADFAINLILVDNNIGKQIPGTLLDAKFKDLSAEQIYDIIKEEIEKNGNYGGMTLDELVDKLLDEHLSGSGEDDEEGDGKGKKKKKPNMSGMSEEEKQKLRDEIKSQLMAAAQNCAGNIPSGMGRLIEGLSAPKMNWREILRTQIQSTIRSDYSFLSPSKKGMSTRFKLPGMKRDETLDICVGIDASGSIDEDDLKAFLSEIYGIMSQYCDYQIHVWSYDTQVYNPEIFRADEGRDISTYQVKGGGGTDFNASYEYMKDNSIDAKIYINFTDLYPCGGFGDPSYCDTIFVVRGGNKSQAPFGLTIHMD